MPVVGLSDRSVQKLDDRGVSDNPTTGTENAIIAFAVDQNPRTRGPARGEARFTRVRLRTSRGMACYVSEISNL